MISRFLSGWRSSKAAESFPVKNHPGGPRNFGSWSLLRWAGPEPPIVIDEVMGPHPVDLYTPKESSAAEVGHLKLDPGYPPRWMVFLLKAGFWQVPACDILVGIFEDSQKNGKNYWILEGYWGMLMQLPSSNHGVTWRKHFTLHTLNLLVCVLVAVDICPFMFYCTGCWCSVLVTANTKI